jgi:hypothetical protein
MLNDILWFVTLGAVWELSDTAVMRLSIVAASIFFPSLIAAQALADIPLWRKICEPIIYFGIGFGIAILPSYISQKIKRRHSPKR